MERIQAREVGQGFSIPMRRRTLSHRTPCHPLCIWRVGTRVPCQVLGMPTALMRRSIRVRRVRMKRRLMSWLDCFFWFALDEFPYDVAVFFFMFLSGSLGLGYNLPLSSFHMHALTLCTHHFMHLPWLRKLVPSHSLHHSIYDTTTANSIPRRPSRYTIVLLYTCYP